MKKKPRSNEFGGRALAIPKQPKKLFFLERELFAPVLLVDRVTLLSAVLMESNFLQSTSMSSELNPLLRAASYMPQAFTP